MKRKGKLWLADWYDENGRRRRKGFPTQKRALDFQNKKQRERAAKKARASARCAPSANRVGST